MAKQPYHRFRPSIALNVSSTIALALVNFDLAFVVPCSPSPLSVNISLAFIHKAWWTYIIDTCHEGKNDNIKPVQGARTKVVVLVVATNKSIQFKSHCPCVLLCDSAMSYNVRTIVCVWLNQLKRSQNVCSVFFYC